MFKDNLKNIRTKKNISQRELGRQINKTGQYISYLENTDEGNPSLDVIKAIAEALDVPIDELLYQANIVNVSGADTSYRKALETFMFDNDETFKIINFLENNGYEIFVQNSNDIVIFKNEELIVSIEEADFNKCGNNILKLIDISKIIADKFVDDIINLKNLTQKNNHSSIKKNT
ncbi:helix-turn-helix domain protein [Clostridium homopropionicum DSM 5847]|uniref:Helix-turn-helix domain protein n=1 Tax=Clostridium homopropionicum DSM 5847 TaxID=1121318 RepID=A0A0L6Z5T8_9CLOT|nr:helix-turn-helix domain-containing protein [Clostridium homopropionicum]KOA18327.1 helix-turn-helix domain protein [Clostridium homopropionicum DSM 5847]SFF69114.1 Helix-turn-helix domain-containing protein [Clostridium homopropionicum]